MSNDSDTPTTALAVHDPHETALTPWVEGPVYGQLKTLANQFAGSQMVPSTFKGKPHDCFIAVQLAHRQGVDPFLALQNLNIIQGRPSWRATFAMELSIQKGYFSQAFDFEVTGSGPTLEVTAVNVVKKTGKTVKATASMRMAEIEGWTSNVKYKSMPEQMLCYRSATMLMRRYAPAVLAGLPTTEEVLEERDVSPRSGVSPAAESMNERIKKSRAKPEPERAADAATESEPGGVI